MKNPELIEILGTAIPKRNVVLPLNFGASFASRDALEVWLLLRLVAASKAGVAQLFITCKDGDEL